MQTIPRRRLLQATASGLGLASVLKSLGPLRAEDMRLDQSIARMQADIEPLVRFLEDTPSDQVIEKTAQRIRGGLSYRELLAALLLAGVRNVQPRPSVGFKFHAVLVVNSAHLASLSGLDEERWLPILWAVDNFKQSQARDTEEGNWTLPAVDETAVPEAHQAEAMLRRGLEDWDESAADAAAASMVRHFGMHRVFDLLAEYAARDFRSIGHKVIYLSNGFRTLQTIGWEYAEPVVRSLVYAMLNHTGEPNPARSDLAADSSGRINAGRASRLEVDLQGGNGDAGTTLELVRGLHDAGPDEASGLCFELLQRGTALGSVWDGLFGSAAELLMRQPGIVALHAVTTTNAMRYAFDTTSDNETRKFLVLQNASFLSHFRQAAADRGRIREVRIDELANRSTDSVAEDPELVGDAFEAMGESRSRAAEKVYDLLAQGVNPQSVVDHARRLVFLKGNDSHDYKFSSAALEDYRKLSPEWQHRFLAASMYQLCSPHENTRPLVSRIQAALT